MMQVHEFLLSRPVYTALYNFQTFHPKRFSYTWIFFLRNSSASSLVAAPFSISTPPQTRNPMFLSLHVYWACLVHFLCKYILMIITAPFNIHSKNSLPCTCHYTSLNDHKLSPFSSSQQRMFYTSCRKYSLSQLLFPNYQALYNLLSKSIPRIVGIYFVIWYLENENCSRACVSRTLLTCFYVHLA